jgi:hypothetical protein
MIMSWSGSWDAVRRGETRNWEKVSWEMGKSILGKEKKYPRVWEKVSMR